MADDARWLIREITDVVAAATEFGSRRATGEQIPWHEQVELQRRKVFVLRAIAERSQQGDDVLDVLSTAELRLQQITTPAPSLGTRQWPDLGATP